MAKFKRKLDAMMGDTSQQEARIRQRVQQQLQVKPKKRAWQMPVVASAAGALAVFLFSSAVGLDFNSADEGYSTPYDPLDDLVEVIAQKRDGQLSTYDFTQFESLPTIQAVERLQYVDRELFSLNGKSYQAVLERQPAIFNEISYKVGDIVRTTADLGSHLPIYEDEYYEVIAVPGDRIILEDGRLRINGKRVDSALLDKYEEMNVDIVGGIEQKLNAREYLLLNYFPAEKSAQPAAVTAVHKIYGKVVGLAAAETTSIYSLQTLAAAPDVGPEVYFDLYLYDSIFGQGELATQLTAEGSAPFPYADRIRQYFIEAGYREVEYVSATEAIIRYDYGRQGGSGYQFTMYKQPGTNVWQWGLK